jgi:hypothetical protein
MPTKPEVATPHEEPERQSAPSKRSSGGAAGLAAEILAGTATEGADHYVRALGDDKDTVVAHAARVLEELANQKPELLSAFVERFASLLCADHQRASICAAHVLPALARIAPAKVAKQLAPLQAAFDAGTETTQEGLLRTFVALCVASVTYQKRFMPLFERALQTPDDKALVQRTQLILPALKGEPYAQLRSVVEARLPDPNLPRPSAQRIADTLGVKLRPLAR